VYRPDRWKGFREDYRFTGKEEDVEVGLQYFGKRFLSPYLNRWVSPDPLSLHSPTSGDPNVLAYVRGSVLKSVDPFGLDSRTTVRGDEIQVSTTIHVRTTGKNGADLSKFIEHLNEDAVNVFKDSTARINGKNYKISFNVNFEAYREGSVIRDGDNIMTFNDAKALRSGRAFVSEGRHAHMKSANFGDSSVMHETGHLLGLIDRYKKTKTGQFVSESPKWNYNLMGVDPRPGPPTHGKLLASSQIQYMASRAVASHERQLDSKLASLKVLVMNQRAQRDPRSKDVGANAYWLHLEYQNTRTRSVQRAKPYLEPP
jgi:RHS repeat-associated protein